MDRNRTLVRTFRHTTMAKALNTAEEYAKGIREGNRVLLGQAITLVESARPEHQQLANQLIGLLLSEGAVPSQTLRIGITGAPGVGKSTFIEALGNYLTSLGKRVAVLAIDPSSQISKGSILGDKTRMEQLAASDLAFIRPSPAGNSLGGVARKTRETILLVEAAGYEIVLIETVGVGQSETAVHSMTDLFLLLLLPGAGDELQGIKRGIVEMADILCVNKAEGDRVQLAKQASVYYSNATHLLPPAQSGWAPQVLRCSAQEGTGIKELWETMEKFRAHVQDNNFFAENRRQQAAWWFQESIRDSLLSAFFQHPEVRQQLQYLEPLVLQGKISPFAAAEQVLGAFPVRLNKED
ncbi:MAG: methylmalonyl Co-A mutase-associated GTPase MeaB [Lewinellaceae bacterium]|nr:methylmalonyl Co-A mutase-associated GTPase MeaB [Lewinellaceae bacterium]